MNYKGSIYMLMNQLIFRGLLDTTTYDFYKDEKIATNYYYAEYKKAIELTIDSIVQDLDDIPTAQLTAKFIRLIHIKILIPVEEAMQATKKVNVKSLLDEGIEAILRESIIFREVNNSYFNFVFDNSKAPYALNKIDVVKEADEIKQRKHLESVQRILDAEKIAEQKMRAKMYDDQLNSIAQVKIGSLPEGYVDNLKNQIDKNAIDPAVSKQIEDNRKNSAFHNSEGEQRFKAESENLKKMLGSM